MPTQEQRSEATRTALIEAFRASFLSEGVEATTTQKVLTETGLSKGALYHHFRSTAEIAEAIYRRESHGAIMRAFGSVSSDLGPIARLKSACAAWLEEMQQPDVARIVLEIGPEALGLERVLEIENELSLKLFEDVLAEAARSTNLTLRKPALAARLINAMMAEVAIQKRADRSDAARVVDPVIDAILGTLSD